MLLLSHFLLLSFQCSPSWWGIKNERLLDTGGSCQSIPKHTDSHFQALRVQISTSADYSTVWQPLGQDTTFFFFLLLTSALSAQPLYPISRSANRRLQGSSSLNVSSCIVFHITEAKRFLYYGLVTDFVCVCVCYGCYILFTLWYKRLFSHSNNFWMDLLVCKKKKKETHKEFKGAINQPIKTSQTGA